MKLLLVDDEFLIRQGLSIIMSSYDDIEVVGSCAGGEEAIAFCMENPVDLILMDIRMQPMNGVEATEQIINLQKNIKILMLTTFKDEHYIAQALEAGALGYLLKDSSGDKIHEALRSIYSGHMVLEESAAQFLISQMQRNKAYSEGERPSPSAERTGGSPSLPDGRTILQKRYSLSEKELDLIQLVAEGLSNKEICERLYLAEGTVKNGISTILSKLDLRDRTQLAIFAYKNQICQS